VITGLNVETLPVNKKTLEKYSTIPISFEVKSKLDIELISNGLEGIVFHEQIIDQPYTNNFDEQEKPVSWADMFNMENWCMFLAKNGDTPVGGILIACKTPEVRMLEGRNDLADVWDIRVMPEYRHKGIGTVLFQKAIIWSKVKGYKQLKVETQNVNVRACKFYAKQGCKLGGINRFAYWNSPLFKSDIQLLWYLDL
jgi:GNAT superfamily N-acetyltransferase